MTDARLAISTAGTREQAEHIARLLVESNLAACVNVIPGVHSYYHWRGRLEKSDEWLLFIKTTAAQADALGARLKELHSYECPEFLVLDIERAAPDYLAWILATVSNKAPGEDAA